MSIIITTIIIFLCTVNGKGEWSLHDLEVGEVQNLHKISNVGGCQLREKLARGGNWAMFRFKAMRTIARLGVKRAVFRAGAMRGSIIIIIIIMINDHCYYNTFRCLAIEAVKAFKDYILLPVHGQDSDVFQLPSRAVLRPFKAKAHTSWAHTSCTDFEV